MISLTDYPRFDPQMLLSLVNQQLRVDFSSLEDLASYHGLSQTGLCQKLNQAGYYYLEGVNQFRLGSQAAP